MTLSQNRLAVALLGVQTNYTGLRRSIVYRWFTDASSRTFHPERDHAVYSRQYVASLRAVFGRLPEDRAVCELVDALLRESAEFAELWERHEVGTRAGTLKTFVHRAVGTIVLDCQILTGANPTEQLVVFTATPGSEDAGKVAVLAAIAARGMPLQDKTA